MQLKVRNFQAVGKVDLEVEGLTVLTGKSNLGKSAIVRSLGGLIFGLPGNHYVKRGEVQCGVRVIDGKNDLEWRKAKRETTATKTSLTVNGKRHTKLGRDQDFLTKSLGIIEIETRDGTRRPQIAEQHDPIFLVAEAPATISDLISRIGGTRLVTAATEGANKFLRRAKLRENLRLEDKKAAEEYLEERKKTQPTEQRITEALEALAKSESTKAENLLLLEKIVRVQQLKLRLFKAPPQNASPKSLREINYRIDLLKRLERLKVLDGFYLVLKDRNLSILTEQDELNQERTNMEKMMGSCPTCERTF